MTDPLKYESLLHSHQYGTAVMIMFDMVESGYSLSHIQHDLVYAMNQFIDELIASGGVTQAQWLWRKCVQICNGRSPLVTYNYFRYLISNNDLFGAMEVIKKCISLQPSYTLALEGLENLKGLVVDQWHFRMLNDAQRNTAYDNAIRRAVSRSPDCVVLDIGGGTGLLSMFAARAGAKHVYCCEVSPPMAELARRCIALNGYADRITVLEAHSTDIQIGTTNDGGNAHLPDRVDVVVTELVDSGLLGEHIVAVLRDARSRLLRPGGTVIPHSADVYGVAVSSDEVARRQTPVSPSQGEWNVEAHRQLMAGPGLIVDEEYTCESLARLVCQKLTHSFLVCRAELCGPGGLCVTPSVHSPITAISDGTVDAVCLWFTLYLEDPLHNACLETVSVNTSPERDGCGWDQAVVFTRLHSQGIPTSINIVNPVYVHAGDELPIGFSFTDDRIHVTVSPQDSYPIDSSRKLLHLGEMDLAAINDEEVTDKYLCSLQAAVSACGVRTRVLELCGGWRSHCLTLAIQGNYNLEGLVVCSCEEQCNYLCEVRNTFGDVSVHCVSGPLVDMYMQQEEQQPQFDVIVCDVVEGCGLIRQGLIADVSFALKFMTSCPYSSALESQNPQPTVVPYSVTAVVALYHDHNLWKQNRVCHENTVGIDIGSITNAFGAVLLRELDLRGTLPCGAENTDAPRKFLSCATDALNFTLLSLAASADDGKHGASSVVSSQVVTVNCESSGTVHAIALWFRIYMTSKNDIIIDTGPMGKSQFSHWRQIAFLLHTPLDVRHGDKVSVEVILDATCGVWCRTV